MKLGVSVHEQKKRVKFLLCESSIKVLSLNYLAEILRIWCTARKNHEKAIRKMLKFENGVIKMLVLSTLFRVFRRLKA